jgi:hypothetical protein
MQNNYEATELHFENLRARYGNPIIILNLIKVSLPSFWSSSILSLYLHMNDNFLYAAVIAVIVIYLEDT